MSGRSATVKFYTRAPRPNTPAPHPSTAATLSHRGAVSVVIPAFNAARSIAQCLASLAAQTARAHEIIVVNDASTDETATIATRLNVKVFTLPRNMGAGYARSFGAGKASGEIIAFIDSDCVAPADWIASIVAEFNADASLGAIGGRYSHPRDKSFTSLLARVEEEYAHHTFSQAPLESNPAAGNSAVRKDVWERDRTGGEAYLFRGINSGEDEFVFNELRRNSRVRYIHSLVVSHVPREAGGYFRRHVNRGRSFALRLTKNMLSDTKGGMKAYGGYRLFFASMALGLAVLCAAASVVVPWTLAGAAGFLLLSALLAREFLRFVRTTNAALSDGEKITFVEQLGIALLLPVRSACWVGGAFAYLVREAGLRLAKQANVVVSILHFWVPGRVSRLFYFVTSACNARCEFCFNLDNVENWKERKPLELTLEEVRKVAERLKRLPYLNLSGGEPFMRPDLADVIEAFHTRSKTQWVTIPTNASLTKLVLDTTQEILTRCPTMFLTIQISLDGMKEAHDQSRKIEGGFDAMIKTLKGLSRLRKWYPNLRVQIATCFDDFNLARMPEMIRFCRDHFDYDQQMFYLIRETGKLITQSKNHLVQPYLQTIAENEEYEWRHNRRSLWNRAVRALQGITYADVARIRQDKHFFRPCHATRSFVTLYDDGQISPCEVLDSVKLGNVRDFGYDYYELIRRKEAAEFYRKDIVANKCNCDWMCAVPQNMLYDPKIIPRVAKALFSPEKLA
jgi:MoaA/NifB/PqqE/SkfB family radical SAM enzyme/glycosyltransferase involved in cell wall biosynthesis